VEKETKNGVEYYKGSTNVYKDLGFKNPEEAAAKAALASRIYDIIEARGLTQKKAAELLGIDQPGVSDLRRGRFRRFSIGRMMGFLKALDQDVSILVQPKSHDTARLQVAEMEV
jgi:predicted XRE-type DNA-binding protein